MNAQAIATLIAAGVALVVGLGGVSASFFQATRVARATLRAQLNAAKIDALVTIVRLVELRGMAIQDRIFNLTVAEHVDHDLREYVSGPQARDVEDPNRTDFAESAALVAAHGDSRVRGAFQLWSDSVDAWNARYEALRWNWEQGDRDRTRPTDVAAERDGEVFARRALGDAVNVSLRELADL